MSTTVWNVRIGFAWDQTIELTSRLQAGTANKEAVNVGLLGELAAVLLADGATVDDADLVGGLGGDGLAEPLADGGVDLLGLLGGSDLAGTDGPGNEVSDPSICMGRNIGGGSLTRRARRQ